MFDAGLTSIRRSFRSGQAHTLIGSIVMEPTRTHEGRVALVTGAAQGLGRAFAIALAERGARVIVTDVDVPEATAKLIGSAARAFVLDVTKEEDWRLITENSGDVDIVVNNAGFFPNRPIEELD